MNIEDGTVLSAIDVQDIATKARELPRSGLISAICNALTVMDAGPGAVVRCLCSQIAFSHQNDRRPLAPINAPPVRLPETRPEGCSRGL